MKKDADAATAASAECRCEEIVRIPMGSPQPYDHKGQKPPRVLSICVRLHWNRGHTSGVHVRAIIDGGRDTETCPIPVRRGTSGSTCRLVGLLSSGANAARWACVWTLRLNGRRENFLVTTCDAASLVARLYKTQIAGPYARRHAVWRVRCNRMR